MGRSPEALATAQDFLRSLSANTHGAARVESVCADISDPLQAGQAIERAVAHCGGLDILINNAGARRFKELCELSVDDWREVIGTNLDGTFYCCRFAIPEIRQRGSGWIINISSLAGGHPFLGGSAYCASKAGLEAMTEVLMQEVRFDKIRVSLVVPGSVNTGVPDPDNPDADSWKLSTDDVARVVIDILRHDSRSLPSRVEIRPSRPRR